MLIGPPRFCTYYLNRYIHAVRFPLYVYSCCRSYDETSRTIHPYRIIYDNNKKNVLNGVEIEVMMFSTNRSFPTRDDNNEPLALHYVRKTNGK